jgi:thiol-disulfide isomerase/thioredoxin
VRSIGGPLALLALVMCAALFQAEAAPRTLAQECPLLSASPLASAHLAELPVGMLLRAGSITVTTQDVDGEIAKASPDVRSQLERNRVFVLEQLAMKRLVSVEAEQWAKTTKRDAKETETARVQAYLGSIATRVTITDADLRRFYSENKEMLGGVSFEQVKPQLTSYVLRQKREEAKRQYVNTLSERVGVELAGTWVKTQYRQLIDNPVDKARLSGRPSLVDFGAEGCVACETMAPILTLLGGELKGKADVLFVDVRKEQVLGSRFGVRTIPLQVFFDREGKEVFRHVGVFPEAQLRAKLAELGVK